MRKVFLGAAVIGALLVFAAWANAGHKSKAGMSCTNGSCAVTATAAAKEKVVVKATASGCSAAATSSCAGKVKKERGRFHLFGKRAKGCGG